MKKYVLRGFSAGVFCTAFILLIGYMLMNEENKQMIDKTAAQAYVKEQGFHVLTDDEIDKLIEEKLELDKQQEEVPKEETTITTEIKIESGMLPQEIAQQLEEAGIIEYSEDFTSFLKEFNYSQKLRVGTYQVNNQQSYKELADLFSKS
ncbi:endolytic transglycosylase MltG [Cytobacillus kochii]|uniref:endolytic transglycosylase MltG n=1 Tax=Cytobacillus kochii TaxID=859143 RepID=UPI001CD43E93|nr:endolytic transglycosylase MltG [Cytobacillus kochii]MCA1025482.1 endolytic transglycosylase MltG [Cytobacillus kochii]MCM3320585.1 endolytic transglycosylase MltG [Cytobacillus kochii]MCM3344581.1 endolytic transglycosylase MltG [Cytobacillus kochii]MDM5208470.1 endolytic transglycosylase MltG [Cytobacillus kochii]